MTDSTDIDPRPSIPAGAVDLAMYLVYCAMSIRLSGWVSKGAARDNDLYATAEDAMDSLESDSIRPSQLDVDTARDALQYVSEDLAARGELNSYQRNLAGIIDNTWVGERQTGFAASIINYAVRGRERAVADIQRKLNAADSAYIGAPKQRVTFRATVERKSHFDGRFGTTHIIKFRSVDGDAATWFASRSQDVNVGDLVEVTGTVKKHGEYRGEKQTTMTRCRLTVETPPALDSDPGDDSRNDECNVDNGEVPPDRRLCNCPKCRVHVARHSYSSPVVVPQEWRIDD